MQTRQNEHCEFPHFLAENLMLFKDILFHINTSLAFFIDAERRYKKKYFQEIIYFEIEIEIFKALYLHFR